MRALSESRADVLRATARLARACVAGLVAFVCSQLCAPPVAVAGAATEAQIRVPLSTSITTMAGEWATVPMGHLDQPLNTFWQLMFRRAGTASWSDQVEATAVATNGGLVMASPEGGSLVVGIRPSNLLTFSPLVATSDARSWSNGLLAQGLVDRPGALAVDGSAAMALVQAHRGTELVSSAGGLSTWRTITTQSALASSVPGRRCGIYSIDAVGYAGVDPVLGASCSHPGVVGLFSRRGGGWHLDGPLIRSWNGRGTAAVLALEAVPGSSSLCALVSMTEGSRSSLVAACEGATSWTTSRPLQLSPHEQIDSVGPAYGVGFFALLSGSTGAERLAVAQGEEPSWRSLPSPPSSTSTVSFGPAGTVDALVARDTTLTVWRLDSGSASWLRTQSLQVPIVYGSSQ